MVFDRASKLRLRRRMRMRQHQVEDMSAAAERQFETMFLRRIDRLVPVWRFVTAWSLLVLLLLGLTAVQTQSLGKFFQFNQPVTGGVLSEGVVGAFTTSSPIYATSPVDIAASKLVFSGLLRYNENGELIGDLAETWTVDERETTYIVTLKDDIHWHDGSPITADDVAFTFKTIQNPDAQSPFASSWRGVTINVINQKQVTFTLPSALAPFAHSLTMGIVPNHILKDTEVSNLRTSRFNTNPIGSGPFAWKTLEVQGGTPETREERIGLVAFDDYHNGAPKLDGYVIRTFRSEKRMIDSFKEQEITAMSGLDSTPSELDDAENVVSYGFTTSAAVMAFFNNSIPLLSEKAVRSALVQATDQNAVISQLDYPAVPVTSPILRGQLGYNMQYQQLAYNQVLAKEALEKAGWKLGKDGVRVKDGKKLQVELVAKSGGEYAGVAKMLQQQWRSIGVKLDVRMQPDADFQATLSNHSYDILLYGISIGADPDVYAFWDSAQADVRSNARLNFSEYKSAAADIALEAARSSRNPQLRIAKYAPFLQAWRNDAPALGLYQPQTLFISRGQIYGLRERNLPADVNRYDTVSQWMVRSARAENN